MTLLRQSPRTFWRSTPAETAALLQAYRIRENRVALREAWKISLLLQPHVTEEARDDVSWQRLFKTMPGSYPEDIEGIDEPYSRHPPGLTEDQIAERERRMRVKRIQRPRKR